MRTLDRTHLASKLRAKLHELNGHPLVLDELRTEADPELVDHITADAGRDLAAELLTQEAATAHDIELALAKLENGRYGRCEDCGDEIPATRLRAVPWARLCLGCQRAFEG